MLRSAITAHYLLRAYNDEKAIQDLVLDVDALLERFSEVDPVAAQLVKLRMYAGQSVVEAGQHLGLTRWSAYQLWHFCRSWFEVHARDL